MPDKPSNTLIVSKIPKVLNGSRKEKINLNDTKIFDLSSEIVTFKTNSSKFKNVKDDITVYTTEIINLNDKFINKTICNRKLCCNFNLKLQFNHSLINQTKMNYYR